MRIIDKYPQFQDRQRLLAYLVESVWATMHLENQGVSKPVLEMIAKSVLYDEALEQGQLPMNKVVE